MGTVFSIRGTNGSGKSTVARRFLPAPITGGKMGGPVDLNWCLSPTKRDPARQKRMEGYCRRSEALGTVGVVGPYRTSCGGMDQMPDFAACRGAIDYMLDAELLRCNYVIAEGLLASGVYGSWGTYAAVLRERGHEYAFCYLQASLDVCKERIVRRQEAAGKVGKTINWTLVENKWNNVRTNRDIALRNNELVYDLPFEGEVEALIAIMHGNGETHRVR